MLLCLDVGNSHIFGGVFDGEKIKLRFRYASEQVVTSDQLGLFLRAVLRENTIDPKQITKISLCSVVPSLDYSITSACVKYFNIEPFALKPGVKTGIKLQVKNPLQLGADRIANAIAAVHHFPDKNIIITDLGTATTYCAISSKKEYVGGVIMPGLKLAMQALHLNTAKLPPVEIIKPKQVLGKTTEQHIQSGLYYGQLGASQQIIRSLTQEAFDGKKPVIIGTGGFAYLFEHENIFTIIIPDLILHGLRLMLEKNR
ncbi:MAG: type III pantothenate kinase [Gammaproteobacteria bacterium]